MGKGYLPLSDAALLDWTNNFAAVSIADPPSCGQTLAQAAEYQTVNTAWVDAYAVSQAPATRGPATILAKNNARRAVIAKSRELAAIAQAYPAITNLKLQALGLTLRDPAPTPVPVPADAPEIDLVSVSGRSVKIRLHGTEAPTRRAKPAGVAGANLFRYVGTTPPDNLSDWTFAGSATRTTVSIDFPEETPAFSKVWITACWYNPRTECGPTAIALSTNLGTGLSQAA